MRVIAGSARRLLLKTIEGLDTRPTTDRIKETLFNMLQPQIPGCFFMDPPYGMELEKRVLEYLSGSPMVTEDTQIIIEASKETDFGWLEEAGYHMTKEKIYKTNKHIFAGKGE